MGNSSAQNTRSAWITQVANNPDSIYQEVGQLVVPGSSTAAPISAHRPALLEDAVGEALYSVVCQCRSSRRLQAGPYMRQHPGYWVLRRIRHGHTQLPTSSTIFQRSVKGLSPV